MLDEMQHCDVQVSLIESHGKLSMLLRQSQNRLLHICQGRLLSYDLRLRGYILPSLSQMHLAKLFDSP